MLIRYELSVSLPLPPPAPPPYVSACYNLEVYSTLVVTNFLFSSFCPTQIAQMLAVLVSKIARIDYPKEWYDFTVTSTSMVF